MHWKTVARHTDETKSTPPGDGLRVTKCAYWSMLIAIYLALVTLHYVALIPSSPYEYITYGIILITSLPLSYITLQILLTAYYGKSTLKYESLKSRSLPSTAVILCVYNDFLPQNLVKTMSNNPGFDYYLLSDSDPEVAESERAFCLQYGVNYVHREERRGKKAGAINDWASRYLDKYSYFVPLDKDSILGENNVRQMLEIAEHPSNRQFGAFQSQIKSLPGRSIFSSIRSTIANLYMSQYPVNDARSLGEAIYWGHNALVRSEAFKNVGGQNENHLNEDISFTMKLREAGYRIAYLTNVQSYEEQPGDIPSEIERLSRWIRGSYQSSMLALLKVRKLGLATSWLISLSGLIYASGALLCILLISSAMSAAIPLSETSLLPVSLVAVTILLIHMGSVLFLGPIFPIKKDTNAGKVFLLLLLNTIMTMPMVLRILLVTTKFIILRRAPWSPTRIDNIQLSLNASFKFAMPEFAFGILLLYLFSLGGPLTLLKFSPFYATFILAPMVIYLSSKNSYNR